MPSSTFELFEDICNELSASGEAILPNEFLSDDRLRDLQDECGGVGPDVAFENALISLSKHFKARDAALPFSYDLATRTFKVTDIAYVEFVAKASGMRGVRRDSRAFEIATANRLSKRGIGSFHRTGWPRSKNKTVKEFNEYLGSFGFDNRVVSGKEKDGGFDILWMLPLGAVPHRPILSFQCKNGSYDIKNASASNLTTEMSFGCHQGLSERVHTLCVVFNDYIEERMLPKKPFPFVPLGLSDLAEPLVPLTSLAVL